MTTMPESEYPNDLDFQSEGTEPFESFEFTL